MRIPTSPALIPLVAGTDDEGRYLPPEAFADTQSSEEAWARRIASGQAGDNMVRLATQTQQG